MSGSETFLVWGNEEERSNAEMFLEAVLESGKEHNSSSGRWIVVVDMAMFQSLWGI
jgi:hypothetical protein